MSATSTATNAATNAATATTVAVFRVGSSVERPFFGGLDCSGAKRTRGLPAAYQYPRLAVKDDFAAFRTIRFVAVASAAPGAATATATATAAICTPASVGPLALSFLLGCYRLRRRLLSLPSPFPSFYTSYSSNSSYSPLPPPLASFCCCYSFFFSCYC